MCRRSLTRCPVQFILAGGPKFEPLYRNIEDDDDDWNEFNGALRA